MMPEIPLQGLPPAQILRELQAFKSGDIPWDSGKVFAYVFDPGEEIRTLQREAYGRFLSENGVDPTVFPSVQTLENEVIGMALSLVGGGPRACGTFTTGGTESILLAVRAVRDQARATRPEVRAPEVVLPHTAHGAFHKACEYFGLKPVIVPVDPDTRRADPAAMAAAITPQTILMVASAPSYAHGVIDPITQLGRIAQEAGICLHVDACVGGMLLPFARKAGVDIPPFGLEVEGVTSLSMDFHKFGYAAKGASCVLYKDRALRWHQLFASADWAGYALVNTGVTSSRTAGPVAAAWATLKAIGQTRYTHMMQECLAAADYLKATIKRLPDLHLEGAPTLNLLAFRSSGLSVFWLADRLKARGWYTMPQLRTQSGPESLHISISHSNVPHVEGFIADLEAVMAETGTEEAAIAGFADWESGLVLIRDQDVAGVTALLQQVLQGTASGDLPMGVINWFLNLLEPAQREWVLKLYFNLVYR